MGTTLEINNDVLWGKLVKSWATGKNLVNGGPPFPIPRTLDELLAIVNGIPGLSVAFPDGMVGLAVIRYSPQTVVLKLPPQDMVAATEAQLSAEGAAYPIPKFYDDFFKSTLPPMSKDELFNLHAARIGDYSIRNCG